MGFLVMGGLVFLGGLAIVIFRRPISTWLGDVLPMGFPDGWVNPSTIRLGGAGLVVGGAFSVLTAILFAVTR